MTDPEKYRPSVTPETWMAPTNGCRFSTLLKAAQFQTLGEATTFPNGRPYGRAALTALMKELRRATGKPVDASAYNRPDALRAYAAVFPGQSVRWEIVVARNRM